MWTFCIFSFNLNFFLKRENFKILIYAFINSCKITEKMSKNKSHQIPTYNHYQDYMFLSQIDSKLVVYTRCRSHI